MLNTSIKEFKDLETQDKVVNLLKTLKLLVLSLDSRLFLGSPVLVFGVSLISWGPVLFLVSILGKLSVLDITIKFIFFYYFTARIV